MAHACTTVIELGRARGRGSLIEVLVLVGLAGPTHAEDGLGSFGDGAEAIPRSPRVAGEREARFPQRYQSSLAGWLNRDGAIRRVFYPLGASDVSTPLSAFAGPRGG